VTINFAVSADADTAGVSIDDVVKAWEARAARVRTLRFKWSDSYLLQRGQALMPATPGVIDPANPHNRVVPERVKTYEPSMSVVIDSDSIRYELNDLTLSLKQEHVPQDRVWVWSENEYRDLLQPGAVHYPLSVGPYLWLGTCGLLPSWTSDVPIYWPVQWFRDYGPRPFGAWLDWYVQLWM
jgi:hypothetical protein